MKKQTLMIASLVTFIIMVTLAILLSYHIGTLAPSRKSTKIELKIDNRQTYSTLGSVLYEKGLIRSEAIYRIYVKIKQPKNLQVGLYKLDKNMDLETLVRTLEKGNSYNPDLTTITFKEGINMRKVTSLIGSTIGQDENEIIQDLTEMEYLTTLISKYWFLDRSILDTDIYYPLEGYLFPETYEVSKKDSAREIVEVMLKHTDKVLSKYKKEIENSKYSVHEMLTLASIVELEAGNAKDRAGVAGVFYNRLNNGWSLGSDVTTYYASKIDDWKYSLTYKELNDCNNSYNTRCKSFTGLPVGPIGNPGLESIKASINPSKHDYFYFVADCKGETYLNKDASGHAYIINKLKAENNWCV